MTLNRADDRLAAPLAHDLVSDTAALYDRLGSLARQLEPAEEVDELTTLLPYAHRIADVTRLISRLLACIVPNGDGVAEVVPALVGYADQVAAGRVGRGTVGTLLFLACSETSTAPRALRDLFLLDADEFAALPEEVTGPALAAAVVALRVVTEYVHGCFGVAGLSRGDVLLELLAGD